MKNRIYCFITWGFLSVFFSNVIRAQDLCGYTDYACYSNGQLFVLKLGLTNDCRTALCYFQTYFQRYGGSIDGGQIRCQRIGIPCGAMVITESSCEPPPAQGIGNGVVIFYKDINYGGCAQTYGNSSVGHLEDYNTSFWAGFGFGCTCICRQNISSIRVAPGMKVMAYDGYDFSGSIVEFTSDCSNLGDFGWNDRISSFVVTANSSTQTFQSIKADLLYDPVHLASTTGGASTGTFGSASTSPDNFDCNQSTIQSRVMLANKCHEGDVKACSVLADCYSSIESNNESQGNFARAVEYNSAVSSYRGLSSEWERYNSMVRDQGENSQYCIDQKAKISNMIRQNKFIFNINTL